MKSMHLIGSVFVASAALVSAHLDAGTLKPSGGETIKIGDDVEITWGCGTVHDGLFDLSFSSDGGKTWSMVANDVKIMAAPFKYTWKVTGPATAEGKIRVCQPDGGATCTNAQNTSSPSASPYRLVSGAFTTQGGANLQSPIARPGAFLRFNSDTRSVDMSFTLEQSQKVFLQVFDTRGKLIANLVDEVRPEGLNRLSIFSNRLNGVVGPLLFNLKIGEWVHTQSSSETR